MSTVSARLFMDRHRGCYSSEDYVFRVYQRTDEPIYWYLEPVSKVSTPQKLQENILLGDTHSPSSSPIGLWLAGGFLNEKTLTVFRSLNPISRYF